MYRCRRCGFTTAPTSFPPARIRRACRQWDPRRIATTVVPRARGLGDTVAWWIDKLSFGRIKERPGCGCRDRRAWLNRLLPYRRSAPPGALRDASRSGEQALRVLLRFPHGLGDAVQLTTVLLHLRRFRPEWVIDIEAKPGAASLFAGLARRVFVAGRDRFRAGDYDLIHTLAWLEPSECYRDSPSTKAERCLREAFHMAPRQELCRYQIGVSAAARRQAAEYLAKVTGQANKEDVSRFRAVVVHYQGNSARRRKNIDEEAIRLMMDRIIRLGFVVVLLDFETPPRSSMLRSPAPDWPSDAVVCPTMEHPIWHGIGTGDGEMLAALISHASLFVGIDSGPAHIAGATDTPSVIVWTGHHPVHYFSPSDNVVHLVTDEHQELLRGNAEYGQQYFEANYAFRRYRELRITLPRIAEEKLATEAAAASEGDERLVVDGDCWVRNAYRAADMVIVRDVDWQDAYRLGELRRRPRTVLDIGAHIGCFAARAHRRWPAAEIACVEANPANLRALQANVGGFARILPVAATYAPGPVRLISTVHRDTDNTGGSYVWEDHAAEAGVSRMEPNEDPSRPTISVAVLTLEQILERCGWDSLDLLKLDCEGCELSILEHANLDRVGVIVGEFHHRERFDALLQRRFSTWELVRWTEGVPGLFWLLNPAHEAPREA